MKLTTKTIDFSTRGHTDIIDLTARVQAAVTDSGFEEGSVLVSAIGSTTGISTVEFEPGLVKSDIKEMFSRIAPYGVPYEHNKTWGDDNGAAHLRSTLTGTSQTYPFIRGQLMLGTWQQVIFIDYDTRPRSRKVVVQVWGV